MSLTVQAGENDNDAPGSRLDLARPHPRNQRLILAAADRYGVKPVFVWQPVPTYDYDLQFHLFAKFRLFEIHPYAKFGYPKMAQVTADSTLGPRFIWAADLQRGLREPLYVDQAHYTARMIGRLAEHIESEIRSRGLF